MNYRTLVDILEANRDVDRVVTYVEGENTERRVSFGEVHARALGILYHLQSLGAQRGDRLLIFLNNNEQFLDGFWAALAGGIVPVPLAVGISDEHRHKLLRVARKLGRPYLYTDSKNLERLRALAAESGDGELMADLASRCFLVESLTDISRHGKLHRPQPSDPAFIQFSSGSTSEPKGVMLTHGNLIANIEGATVVGKYAKDDVTLSWMPLTHDMGLIGFYLLLFANRSHIHLMPTDLFVRRPLLWLQTAARKHVTLTCSPNFGYRHFLKVLGDRKLEDTDLSSIRAIYNGAEPISVPLCNEFMQALAGTGLRRSAMYPVYGLAEASLAVAFPEPGTDYRWIRVNRHRLGIGSSVELNPPDPRDVVELMSVGRALPNLELRIADDTSAPVPGAQVGHILIRGPNVTQGYVGDPEATALAIDAEGWLDTGDLGVMHEGSLYITGRAKEIIFINGQNYYPYDLENIAQRAPGLELNKVVAAGVAKPGTQGEELVVFVLHRGGLLDFVPTANAVSRLINEHVGIEVAQVIPVKRIPKTTSGKVQRYFLEKSYVEGEFDGELAELAALRNMHGESQVSGSELEGKLQAICEAALPGKRIDITDNLFELGASSLKLIEIHENIDREYPGLVDLTELFDHPTIRELAQHLEGKLNPPA
ncbi:MAG TPA: non-ribosomal peptide synthetase [Steroidobacteraceae bacterium]|jgi:acyl-CoA synthetase (AMP-forming)/AMP-acid ligase II/aryl carrier-like protein|nr:non-ribosomal peptide synthetase [Steroidobacteraceae bacterium]